MSNFKLLNFLFYIDLSIFLKYNMKEFARINRGKNMPEFRLFNGNTKQVFKMFKHDNVAFIFITLVAIVVGLFIAITMMFYSNRQNSDKIQTGVFIKGVNVSGLTKDEAIALVKSELESKLNDHIELVYKNSNYYLEVEQIEAKFDIESSVSFALEIGKNGNFFENIWQYINVLMANINIEPILTYNDELLTYYLESIETFLPDQLEQAAYYIEDDELIITNGVNGAGILYDELKEEIVDAIQDISYSNKYIKIPTYVQYPEAINLENIHADVYREVQNAYFTTEPYAVFPDITGIDFDIEDAQNLINENPEAEEYAIGLNYTSAEVTVQDLGKEAFPDLLGTFSTKYTTSNADRTTNLRLAANKIDGTVVMPGEIFSYNKVVGKRTIDAGYKNAAIYQDGEVVDGLGGGICQISTTLYNAVIKAGMLIEERRNHMFVPSYADAGKDATVVWGSTDFKFENRRSYPIKLEASVSGGVATVRVYGLKTDEEYDRYDLSIESKTIKNTSTALVVESYRVYRDENGKIVKTDKLYTDTYKKH